MRQLDSNATPRIGLAAISARNSQKYRRDFQPKLREMQEEEPASKQNYPKKKKLLKSTSQFFNQFS